MASKYKHKFRIDRARWACARPHGDNDDTALLNAQGQMCCLGFLAESCGVSAKNRLDVGYPSSLNSADVRGAKKLASLINDTYDEGGFEVKVAVKHHEEDFININDHEYIDSSREAKLAKMFAENGIKVQFYGKYPRPEKQEE